MSEMMIERMKERERQRERDSERTIQGITPPRPIKHSRLNECPRWGHSELVNNDEKILKPISRIVIILQQESDQPHLLQHALKLIVIFHQVSTERSVL